MTRILLKQKLVMAPTPKIKIFMDSGAFSAYKLKKPIDLDKYCRFLLANQDWITYYANLDVIIPGNPEKAAEQSFTNLLKMRAYGLNPVAVYHVGESLDWLKRILDAGILHIGLGGMVGGAKGTINEWQSMVWSELVTDSGAPAVKVHAFGETSEYRLKAYPWATADSSSWLSGIRFGHFKLPGAKNISHGHSKTGTKAAQDFAQLEGFDAEHFARFLERMKLKPEALENRSGSASWIARNYLSAAFFLDMEQEIIAKHPIKFYPNRWLVTDSTIEHSSAVDIGTFELYLALGGNKTTLPTMYAAGCNRILISYFYVDSFGIDVLRQYTKNPRAACESKGYSQHFATMKGILNHVGL